MKRILLPMGFGIALVCACSLLPDRVYVEAFENPIGATAWGEAVGGDEPLLGVGVEWDLQPTRVVIDGQREAHPWDFGDMMGVYDGGDTAAPVPLVVEDAEIKAMLDALHAATLSLVASNEQLALDLSAMRASSDALGAEWDAINKTLLGGGGLSGLILLLIGGRAALRARRSTPTDEATS